MKTYSDNFVTPGQLHEATERTLQQAAINNGYAMGDHMKATWKAIIVASIINALITIGSVAWLFIHFH